MNNAKKFQGLVHKLKSKDNTYQNELDNFSRYLKDRLLEEDVFRLRDTHIDEYFVYSYNEKIGAENTLNTHLAALKSLFDFLIQNDYNNFRYLYGYINTSGYKDRLSEELAQKFEKPTMDSTLLNSVLFNIDNHIQKNINNIFKNKTEKKRFFESMICIIYAKMSLILPLKPKDMLEININEIKKNNVRCISYNGISIKIPNSFRLQLIQTICFAEKEFGVEYFETSKLFKFLYNAIGKKSSTTSLSESFTKTYEDLGLHEMLKKKSGGIKDKYIYPAESYKITAIKNMLENGTNLVYLKKLTGLDMTTLLSDFDFEKEPQLKDTVSISINNGIVNSEYYTYL